MAETIMKILEPVVGKLGEYLANKIMDQVSYLCCYSCNVERLRDEAPKLEVERETVQQAVDAANRNLEAVRPDVEDWLTRSNDIQKKCHRILTDADNIQKRCLSRWFPILHYSLSRDAKKTSDATVELQKTGKFESVSNSANPQDLEPIPATSDIGFKSRDSIVEEIMDALKDDSVYLIGLCGMAGVGKTTMANKIKKRAKEKMENSPSMFEVVVFAVVSQWPDPKKVQQEIAEGVGLTLEEDSLQIRAEKLHARLKNAKSFLIILDDVWERLDLEKLGIPSKSSHERRKIFLTSRVRDALTLSEDAKILTLDVLTDEEAWNLFREKAGNSVGAPDLLETAKKVAKQCKGLPLALVVVGSALRNKGKRSWVDALRQLKRNKPPANTPQVLQELYIPLQWSYDQLQTEEARYIFLLCCLFPEDSYIPVETLVRYGFGLGIFSGTENLREARDRVYGLVEMLKSRFLLIGGEDHGDINERVKMHDVVRDMAISIASKDRHVFMISDDRNEWPRNDSYENYTHISVTTKGNYALPESIDCPRLEFLRVQREWGEIEIPENFFDSMRGLKVLTALGLKSLPSSMCLLTNLRALHLEVGKLDIESIVGKLVNLEILSLRGSGLKELPKEVGLLKKLKLLDLILPEELKEIAPGVISELVQLEELVILGSFAEWEAEEEGKERGNASLAEVASLSNLATLEIKIRNPNLVSLDLPHWPTLETFYLQIGDLYFDINSYMNVRNNYMKVVVFKCDEVIPLGNFFCSMTRNAEYLETIGDCCNEILNELASEGFQKVRALELFYFNNVEYLADAFHRTPESGVFLTALESLTLESSPSLKQICSGPPPIGSFCALKQLRLKDLPELTRLWTVPSERLCMSNLRSIYIGFCKSLQCVFPLSTAETLSQLEELSVQCCLGMEEIFKEGGEVEITINNKIKFPKLRKLELEVLPSLQVFCKGIEGIEFPALRELEIVGVPLVNFCCPTKCIPCQQFLFNDQVRCTNLRSLELNEVYNATGVFGHGIPNGNFSRLESLEVRFCHNLRNIFTPSMCRDLTNLKELLLLDCKELQEVIAPDEDREGQANIKETLFPQLKDLRLRKLPKLQRFCHMTNVLELPSLIRLKIDNCPMLEMLSLGSLNSATKFLLNKEVLYANLQRLYLEKLNGVTGIFDNGIPIGKLEILRVESCCSLKNIFSPLMSRGLSNLKELEVSECEELEEVIAKDNQEGETKIKETLFPQLEELSLRNLPKICRFCHMTNDIELPSLHSIRIQDCPMMETFSSGPLHLPSIKFVYGMQDPNLASKFFFHEEKSSEEIQMDNSCFRFPLKYMSFSGYWKMYLIRDSSDNFIPVAELEDYQLETSGRFKPANFSEKVLHEIAYIIMLKECSYGWEDPVTFALTISEGITYYRTENLNNKPRGEWLEIQAGEVIVEPNQIGEVEFSLYQHVHYLKQGLIIKGVMIRTRFM